VRNKNIHKSAGNALYRNYFRIVDANLNRATEGLRVCEDVVRFVWCAKNIQARIKSLRHRIKKITITLRKDYGVIMYRETIDDVGKNSKKTDMARSGAEDLFFANAQRVKESVRSLEEVSKLFDGGISEYFKGIRFAFYKIEKDVYKKFVTVKGRRISK